jgi:hypothetical protein
MGMIIPKVDVVCLTNQHHAAFFSGYDRRMTEEVQETT